MAAQSLTHWTTMKVPQNYFWIWIFFLGAMRQASAMYWVKVIILKCTVTGNYVPKRFQITTFKDKLYLCSPKLILLECSPSRWRVHMLNWLPKPEAWVLPWHLFSPHSLNPIRKAASRQLNRIYIPSNSIHLCLPHTMKSCPHQFTQVLLHLSLTCIFPNLILPFRLFPTLQPYRTSCCAKLIMSDVWQLMSRSRLARQGNRRG